MTTKSTQNGRASALPVEPKASGSNGAGTSDVPADLPSAAEPNAPRRCMAPFAMTYDGTLLINADALDAASLQSRALFIGAELTAAEQELALAAFNEKSCELHARIAGALAQRRVSEPDPKAEKAE